MFVLFSDILLDLHHWVETFHNISKQKEAVNLLLEVILCFNLGEVNLQVKITFLIILLFKDQVCELYTDWDSSSYDEITH